MSKMARAEMDSDYVSIYTHNTQYLDVEQAEQAAKDLMEAVKEIKKRRTTPCPPELYMDEECDIVDYDRRPDQSIEDDRVSLAKAMVRPDEAQRGIEITFAILGYEIPLDTAVELKKWIAKAEKFYKENTK